MNNPRTEQSQGNPPSTPLFPGLALGAVADDLKPRTSPHLRIEALEYLLNESDYPKALSAAIPPLFAYSMDVVKTALQVMQTIGEKMRSQGGSCPDNVRRALLDQIELLDTTGRIPCLRRQYYVEPLATDFRVAIGYTLTCLGVDCDAALAVYKDVVCRALKKEIRCTKKVQGCLAALVAAPNAEELLKDIRPQLESNRTLKKLL
ncbi:MAG: hypothetical protein ACOX2O_09700 [Bdellovibrionota bacterium]